MTTESVPEISHTEQEELSEGCNSFSRQNFSLRAFSEMKDTSKVSIIPNDLYKQPVSVVELDHGIHQTSDDSVIKRLTMGSMTAFEPSQKSSTTTTRRYVCLMEEDVYIYVPMVIHIQLRKIQIHV
jgi:hypothetical protein